MHDPGVNINEGKANWMGRWELAEVAQGMRLLGHEILSQEGHPGQEGSHGCGGTRATGPSDAPIEIMSVADELCSRACKSLWAGGERWDDTG